MPLPEPEPIPLYGESYKRDPYPLYTELRERGPVHRVRFPSGVCVPGSSPAMKPLTGH
ncbi:hypothetical protein OEIGOIKO_05856 [Streptomyces chrestomyceticus JCM 4735]|uniref:Cytochrome P450 n=1 Tax=Streptomyces chrestomyceticus JCM 4735 TaxID=1306181 RepID=A0A7U9L1U4_9ACTN|nr:hypothetical protein OEIGOIKO_05856 [Streptomyces chrestomyceticus JCM 4735]